jgi:hypothetical protein
MSWQAEMLGIDLNSLESERFSHPNHYSMLRDHREQVKTFESDRKFERYQELIRLAEEKVVLENMALGEAVQRNRKLKPRKHYRFTNKQLEIAMRSLDNES